MRIANMPVEERQNTNDYADCILSYCTSLQLECLHFSYAINENSKITFFVQFD